MQAFEILEEEFGKWAGVQNVVACSSGTSALHLALEALQLPLGSEVLVPEFTMVACARAVTMAGLTPVFVDCLDDLLMDPSKLYEKWINITYWGPSAKTKAIMPVHVYGRRCDMDSIIRLAKANDLKVIEDLAEAHGVPVHPQTDAACWSFYKNKIVAGEEGGAVAFKSKANADLARKLRSVGFTKHHDFLHHPRGFNARLSNANAELVLRSLKDVERDRVERRIVETWYSEIIPDEWKMPYRDAVWVYDLRIPGLPNVDAVVRYCNEHGVAARHGFKPMSQQPEYCCESGWMNLNAYKLSREVLYLPVYPDLTREDIEHNVETLRAGVATSLATASPG